MIYGYKHWTLEDIPRCFYVGKGKLGRAESKSSRNHKWHAVVKRYGLRVEICIGPTTNEEACKWEISTIDEMKTFSTSHLHDGEDIGCNFTHGGEGTLGRIFSEESKKKISESQKGEKSSWFGRKHSESTKSKISHKNSGKTRSVRARVKVSLAVKGTKFADRGESWKRKIAESNRRRKGIKLATAKKVRKFNNVKKQLVLLCGGPDRCGKTNILRELERRLHVPYFKASGEHNNFLTSQNNFVNELRYADPRFCDLLYQTGHSVLVDRAYMCEWVYSQFFDRETDMRMLRVMDSMYAKLGAKILICTRKSFLGIKDDLDSNIDEEALQKISSLYMEFVKWTRCETYVLYVDDEDLDREVTEILEFVEKETNT